MAALAASSPLPTVVLGDLNEWRPTGSALGVLAPWFGLAPSRPSYPSRLPMFSLDRILGWPLGLVSDVEVHDSPLARKASDHLPLKARLDLSVGMPALPFAA
jgi:endonuclease/exonuclease/phosphatase family metal-dependent hydrolase